MQAGRGGMGNRKHGQSGFAPRNAKYKAEKAREANAEAEVRKRPKAEWFERVSDLFRAKGGQPR